MNHHRKSYPRIGIETIYRSKKFCSTTGTAEKSYSHIGTQDNTKIKKTLLDYKHRRKNPSYK